MVNNVEYANRRGGLGRDEAKRMLLRSLRLAYYRRRSVERRIAAMQLERRPIRRRVLEVTLCEALGDVDATIATIRGAWQRVDEMV